MMRDFVQNKNAGGDFKISVRVAMHMYASNYSSEVTAAPFVNSSAMSFIP